MAQIIDGKALAAATKAEAAAEAAALKVQGIEPCLNGKRKHDGANQRNRGAGP